jgi:hypothetical protein
VDRTRLARFALAAGLCALALAGCGGRSAADRFQLRTPVLDHQDPPPRLASAGELEILRNWGEHLRLRDAVGASRDFVVPAYVSDGTSGWVELADRRAVERFNSGFTCGAELQSAVRRADGFVVGTFQLVEQPGANRCGARTGQLRRIAVEIEGHHITRWVNENQPEDAGVIA